MKRLVDENGVPTVAGAAMMFAANDEARANRLGREDELRRQASRDPLAETVDWLGEKVTALDAKAAAARAEQTTAPSGLTSAEYIRLAFNCLDQVSIDIDTQIELARAVRHALDTKGRTIRSVLACGGEAALDDARLEVEAICGELLKAKP